MNNCSSHGTCNEHGYCECNSGYKGADCAEKAETLVSNYNKIFIINGT
jgi:hypothetical protein